MAIPQQGMICFILMKFLKTMEGADLCILTLGGKHGSCSAASLGEGMEAAKCLNTILEEWNPSEVGPL